MKKIILLFQISIFSLFTANAQELDDVIQYIKLGNTYREVDEFLLSETNLKNALEIIISKYPNQKYWEATANENLGLLFRDNNDKEEAKKYFLKAIEIYQSIGNFSSVNAIQKLLKSIEDKEDFYAGIDVGATGIKLSVLGVKLNSKTKKLDFRVAKKFENINLGLVQKNKSIYTQGANAIATLIKDSLHVFEIPSERLIIALSSGLVGQIGQDTTFLKEEIRKAISNPNQKISVINYTKEAELTIKAIIHPSKWFEISLVDIGSGNTKGGYFLKPIIASQPAHMVGLEFPGTKTYASYIEKKYQTIDLSTFKIAIETDSKELALSIRKEFDENRSEMKRRKKVYLLGGAAYAVNMLMTPDSINETAITMNKFATNSLKKKAIIDIENLRKPDLSSINDKSKKILAEKYLNEINSNIFNKDEDLISAVFLVNTFMQELSRNLDVKEVVFIHGTDNAWITGLIRQHIEELYK